MIDGWMMLFCHCLAVTELSQGIGLTESGQGPFFNERFTVVSSPLLILQLYAMLFYMPCHAMPCAAATCKGPKAKNKGSNNNNNNL